MSEFQHLSAPAEPGDEVAVACPVCDWRSDAVPVPDEVNGTWNTLQGLYADYRLHFDSTHRPLPVRLVRAAEFGSSEQPHVHP